MGSFAYQILGALALDPSIYEYVEARRPSTVAAVTVVIASSLAAGIGAAGLAGPTLTNLILICGMALATWLAWAGLILYVGGLILPERQTRVDYGELVRTIGFAAAPGLFQIFGLFTTIAVPVFVVSWIWMLAAMIVAVRQALDFQSTWRAVGVCVVTLCVVLMTTIAIALALQTRVS
jgi:hypothetical protein